MDSNSFHITHKKTEYNNDWLKVSDAARVAKTDYQAMFSPTEDDVRRSSEYYIERYDAADRMFKEKTSLTSLDLSFLIIAACLQTLRWGLVSNDVGRFKNAKDGEKFIEGIGDYMPATIDQLLMDHQVPYDAVNLSASYSGGSVGLSGTNHRVRALGHDPLAGLIFGTANIATNTLTVNDFSSLYPSYHVRNGAITGKTDLYHVMKWSGNLLMDKPEIIGASLIKQVVHCSTDVFTKQGLPIPVINTISPKTSLFLVGKQIDLYSVVRGAFLAMLINKLIAMCHRLFFHPGKDDQRLYEVRTRKILLYSNTLSSVLNVAYVGLTRDIKRLDIGGLIVTLWRFLHDRKKIREIRYQFINETLDGELKAEEDRVNERLARWGISI